MDAPNNNINVVRSNVDESLYYFYLTSPINSQQPQIRLHSKPGDLVRRGAPILDFSPLPDHQFTLIKTPLPGHLLNEGLIGGNAQKQQKKLLFSIKQCQHYPRDNTSALVPQIQPKLNSPIFNAIEYCGYCDEPIWLYYQKQQKFLTYSELVSQFEEFDIHDFEWKINLNEHFTKNTQIGSSCDESFTLPTGGKAVFLQNISTLKKKSSINPQHVMIKYKKVVCKHEKISNNYCQKCLMSIADIGIHKFKRYLFQVASKTINHSIIVSGKALEQQELQFKQNILSQKKALFILDLDNTILHSIQLFKVPEDMKSTIQDYMIIPPEADSFIEKSFVKIRPYFQKFLSIILPLYEIYVYTKGTRLYGEEICKAIKNKYSHLLNSSQCFTRMSLVSRDQDPNPKKSLTYILPSLKDFILILDDRRDVWDHSPLCIFTKPYYYFFFCANIEGKEKIQAAEWQKGGGSLIKIPVQEHTVPKHDKSIIDQVEQNGESNTVKQGQEAVKTSKNGVKKQQDPNKDEKQKMSLRLSEGPDYFLLFAALNLVKSHELYFQNRAAKQCQKRKHGKYADMVNVQKQLKSMILKGTKVCLMYPNYRTNNNTYRRAIKLGVQILQNSQTTPDIVIRSNDYRKNGNQFNEISVKLKNYGQALKIPVVSESWIDLCYEYSYNFPYHNFICHSPSAIVMYSNPKKLQQIANKTVEECLPMVKKELNIEQEKQLINE